MRLVALSVSIPMIFGFASGATAASCVGFTSVPDTHSGSILFTPEIKATSPTPVGCAVVIDINAESDDLSDNIPAGTVVVYKARYSGALEEDPHGNVDKGHIAVTHDGVTDEADVTDPQPADISDPPYFENYVGSGLDGVIRAEIALSLLEDNTGFGQTSIDTFDYAEAGRTTVESVQASIDQLAVQGTTFVTHLITTSDLLVGSNQPLEAPDSVSLLGALGSHTVGATAHYNLGGGLSLDGGAALFSQGGVSGSLFGGSVRYLEPGVNTFRPFGEIGFNAAPGLDMQFSRSYDDGSPDGAVVNIDTSGSLAGAYIKGGFLVAPDLSNQIAFSGTLMHNWLSVDGYSETFGEDNLFNATVAGGSGGFDTVKASVAWTSALTADLDMTLGASLGRTVSQDGVVTDVAFVGPITGTAEDDVFMQYGARLGWKLSPTTTADVFVNGSTGSVSGTHAQVGAGLRVAF